MAVGNPADADYWKNIIPEYYTIYEREGIAGINDVNLILDIANSISYILDNDCDEQVDDTCGVVDYDYIEYNFWTAGICPDPPYEFTCTTVNCNVCPDYIKLVYQTIPEGPLGISPNEALMRFDLNKDGNVDVFDLVLIVDNYLNMPMGSPGAVDPNSSQVWLGEHPELSSINNNANYYYPVLPKIKANGEFFEINDNTSLLQNDGENKPFGDRGYNWNDDDTKSPATNITLGDRFLSRALIDLDFSQIDEDSLGDNSGNNNLGILINDYRIDFDQKTKKPTKTQPVNKQKLELIKRKAF